MKLRKINIEQRQKKKYAITLLGHHVGFCYW